ncbi:MAG: hypothetical protein ACE5IM_04905 [Nitrospinota bacterium]
MRVRPGRWAALSLMVMSVGLLSGLPAAAAEGGLRRSHSGGGVTIDVTFLPSNGTSQDFRFNVRMNTHSVPLDGYDMAKLSLLRDGRGRLFPATAWTDPGGGGHHRKGVLVFPAKDKNGDPIIGGATKFLEVVIRDVAGVSERVFRWELPLKTSSR